MPYPSVDSLQMVLAENVFSYTTDRKKASGRALGTIVEIISYYLLKAWGFRDSTAIERSLQEYSNPEITHNVEYSIHPLLNSWQESFELSSLPLSTTKLLRAFNLKQLEDSSLDKRSNQLLSSDKILRNSCTIAESSAGPYIAHLDSVQGSSYEVSISYLRKQPYAIVECKRVGVEEGMKKGPQTIEKAKQGAYVAKTVSALQKIRLPNGVVGGLIHTDDNNLVIDEYDRLLKQVVASNDKALLENFILTVGIVSNHGNWFTSDNHNKELKVLAQSYDWLLFLTDKGLSQFINDLLLDPASDYQPVRQAFLESYRSGKKKNRFTKVKMDTTSDALLQRYFVDNEETIHGWFNVISPRSSNLDELRMELDMLKSKDWKDILEL